MDSNNLIDAADDQADDQAEDLELILFDVHPLMCYRNAKKIFIVGKDGSGKNTLARRIEDLILSRHVYRPSPTSCRPGHICRRRRGSITQVPDGDQKPFDALLADLKSTYIGAASPLVPRSSSMVEQPVKVFDDTVSLDVAGRITAAEQWLHTECNDLCGHTAIIICCDLDSVPDIATMNARSCSGSPKPYQCPPIEKVCEKLVRDLATSIESSFVQVSRSPITDIDIASSSTSGGDIGQNQREADAQEHQVEGSQTVEEADTDREAYTDADALEGACYPNPKTGDVETVVEQANPDADSYAEAAQGEEEEEIRILILPNLCTGGELHTAFTKQSVFGNFEKFLIMLKMITATPNRFMVLCENDIGMPKVTYFDAPLSDRRRRDAVPHLRPKRLTSISEEGV